MTSDRSLGSAAAGDASKAFNADPVLPFGPGTRLRDFGIGVALLKDRVITKDPDTEGGGLHSMRDYLLKSHIALLMNNDKGEPVMPEWGKTDAAFSAKVKKYLNADGDLDQNGMVRFMAETVNDDPKSKSITPDPLLVKKTSDMLTRLGINDDKDHTLATTVAKGSVIGSQNVQDYWDKVGRPELEAEMKKNAATTAPATRPAPAPVH